MRIHMKRVILSFLSFIIFIFAAIFSFTANNYTHGDQILNCFHIPCWSNGNTGTHYAILFSVVILVISHLCKPKALLKEKENS